VGERLERAIRAAAVGAGLLGLLAIAAIASGRGHPGVSGTTDIAAVANLRDAVLTIGITFYALALALVVWALLTGRRRVSKLDRPSGIGALVMFLLVAVAIALAVGHRPERLQEAEEPGFGLGRPSAPREASPAAKEVRPARFRWELAAGIVAVGAAALAVALVRGRAGAEGMRDPGAKRELAAAELAGVVEGTIDDLRREADPRRAVIAAYAQMERVLVRHGLPRDRAEAPFEYLGRMLSELRVRPEAALALTELFERARFSHHEIDAAMKDEAIDALVSVRDDLRAS
jgi:hypothetical protein